MDGLISNMQYHDNELRLQYLNKLIRLILDVPYILLICYQVFNYLHDRNCY